MPSLKEGLTARETVPHYSQACEVPVGIFTTDGAKAGANIKQGFSLIALGMEAFFLWQSAEAALAEVRAAPSDGGR